MPEPRDYAQVNLYQDFSVVNDYTIEPGVCILPLAQEPPTSETELRSWSPIVELKLHAPYRIRKQKTQAEKQNNPPVVPSPESKGSFVFTGGNIVIANGGNMTWCNFDWSIHTEYLFVENCVHRIEDGFVLGGPSFPYRASAENSQNYAAATPQSLFGAISHAGVDARVGYTMGKQVVENKLTAIVNPITGIISPIGWGYNQSTFLPGCFFNDEMANGGPDNSV